MLLVLVVMVVLVVLADTVSVHTLSDPDIDRSVVSDIVVSVLPLAAALRHLVPAVSGQVKGLMTSAV